MCGRYFFQLKDHKAFQKLRKKLEQMALFEYAKEEVFPSQQALVLVAGGQDYQLNVMKWGIQGFKSNLLINARSEGIHEKKTFRPMLSKRCLIPCNGFFEWVSVGSKKEKIFIHKQDEPLVYLAGIYNEQKEFVIVTGESVLEMKSIHNRTPIMVKEEQIPQYLQGKLTFEVDNNDLLFENITRSQNGKI